MKPVVVICNQMVQSGVEYTRLRWLLTFVALLLYVGDIVTDIALVVKYLQEKNFVWMGLTLAFIGIGLLVTQVFSFVWNQDDMNIAHMGNTVILDMDLSKHEQIILHLCGVGIIFRYYHLLKQGFKVLWPSGDSYTVQERTHAHHSLICLATDLSMLRLFESFLENAPQLVLQLYIVLVHQESSVMQYLSTTFSFLSLAWALVDYRRCLRRSLPNTMEMPSGLPTVIYLLYKLCTITSHILSLTLLIILSTYSTTGLVVLWLLGTTWAHLLQTNFCTSSGLEVLYRAVIGVILTFTFFNVKGQNTRGAMLIYYLSSSVINILSPLLLVLLKPELLTSTVLLSISSLISGGWVLGLVCLMVYYLFLHPREMGRQADEVDGCGKKTETTMRMQNFLQP